MPKKIKPKTKTAAKKTNRKKPVTRKRKTTRKKAPKKQKKLELHEEFLQQALKQPLPKMAEPEPEPRPTKFHLWLFVIIIFAVIFVFWVISLKTNIKLYNPGFRGDVYNTSDGLSSSLTNLESNVESLEESANNNVNAIINNPHDLSEEEIQSMEDKVFPKLKQ